MMGVRLEADVHIVTAAPPLQTLKKPSIKVEFMFETKCLAAWQAVRPYLQTAKKSLVSQSLILVPVPSTLSAHKWRCRYTSSIGLGGQHHQDISIGLKTPVKQPNYSKEGPALLIFLFKRC